MLAGPDLLVILVIAVVVFGPQKLPELAKTLGRAMREFKKSTEDMKEAIGIKELGEIRGSLTGMDLFVDLAERVSVSMPPQESTGEASIRSNDSLDGKPSSPAEGQASVGDEGKLEKIGLDLQSQEKKEK